MLSGDLFEAYAVLCIATYCVKLLGLIMSTDVTKLRIGRGNSGELSAEVGYSPANEESYTKPHSGRFYL